MEQDTQWFWQNYLYHVLCTLLFSDPQLLFFTDCIYIYKQDFLYLHDKFMELHGTSHHQTSELDQFW